MDEKAEMLSSSRRNGSDQASKTDEDAMAPDAVGDLVVACQKGEREAQQKLYEICHKRIYRLMVRMVGLQDAADLTQQAFRNIGQFSGRSKFETWLCRLAVNESLQHLRRRRRWQVQPLEREPMDPSNERGRRVEHREDGSTIVIFEHGTEQPVRFGKCPCVAAECGGKRCNIVRGDMPLAATWNRDGRQVTVIGARDMEEVSTLIEWLEQAPSA